MNNFRILHFKYIYYYNSNTFKKYIIPKKKNTFLVTYLINILESININAKVTLQGGYNFLLLI